jgi:hypothetical protein
MILHRPPTTNGSLARPVFLAVIAAAAVALAACSKDDPTDAGEPLCGGETGVGLRVEGRAEPLEVCVNDRAVEALLTSQDRYDVSAQMNTDDGIYQLRMVFARRPDFPVSLRLVSSINEVTGDPGAVYVYYEELPDGGTPIESGLVLGGKFRLSFSDDKVAAGTLQNISFEMNDVVDGDPAGQRKIVEGFFSISIEQPSASEFVAR